MDISIITASIGSFVLSERVIKVSQLVGQSCSRRAYHTVPNTTIVLFARFDFMLTSISMYMCCFASHPSPPTTRTAPSLSNPYAVSGLACRSVFVFPFDRRSLHLYRNQAKASILAVLGTVVAYDLTQTSEDPWSLRVYRGELWFSKHGRELLRPTLSTASYLHQIICFDCRANI